MTGTPFELGVQYKATSLRSLESLLQSVFLLFKDGPSWTDKEIQVPFIPFPQTPPPLSLLPRLLASVLP